MASEEEEITKVAQEVTTEKEEVGEPEIEEKDDEKGEEEEESERIRGGGKVSGAGGSRGNRRHTPYGRNKPDAKSGDGSKSRRVYVGNLSWDVSWQDLKDHMKTTGCDVARANVMSTSDGRSKGCGIVEFATVEDAEKAVLTLNDTELNGRQIFIREDREDHAGGGGRGGGFAGTSHRFSSGDQAQSCRVYVGNLSWDVAWQDLKDHMRQAGEVVHAEVITEANGRSKGCGVVEFQTADEAEEAVRTLTDTELKGRMIFVREDRETSSGAAGGFYQGGGRRQGTSVYVWNLSYETSWQSLKDHMRGAGNVDQATILSGHDGRSIGCGVVVYQRPQEAARAIRKLQNTELDGREISIREDRNQAGGGGGGRRGGGHGSEQGGRRGGARGGEHGRDGHGGGAGCQLFVGNLSYDTNWQDLKDHFREIGDVERAEVMESADGRKKGFGTVRFFRQEDADTAIRELNGVELQGRALDVRVDHKAR